MGIPPEKTADLALEVVALRAEVERLKRGGAQLGRILDRSLRDVLDASGRHDVIGEDGDGDWAVVWETLAGLRSRAEAAEAALADARRQDWDRRGGPLWLSREEWGVVIDALIQHRGHAEDRKAANSESTSDVRADTCVDLIGRIHSAAALSSAASDAPEATPAPTTEGGGTNG